MDLEPARQLLEDTLPFRPEFLIVLGSGLGRLVEGLDRVVEVPFGELPGLPPAGVAGHRGRFLAGLLEGRRVLLQDGRFHFYEGHGPEVVAAPVRIAAGVGAGTVILTNAAGGIRPHLGPGDLMLIDDHLNLQWRSPLAGPVAAGDERFLDMSAPYDPSLQRRALEAAAAQGVPLRRGVYAAVPGPNYETPAEVRMLARLGADAVGMSTVPEVIAARARGLRVLGLSLITNRAAGLAGGTLSHEEVLEVGERAAGRVEALVRRVVALSPGVTPEGALPRSG